MEFKNEIGILRDVVMVRGHSFEIDAFKLVEEKFTAELAAIDSQQHKEKKQLCLSCSRLLSNGGTCQPIYLGLRHAYERN